MAREGSRAQGEWAFGRGLGAAVRRGGQAAGRSGSGLPGAHRHRLRGARGTRCSGRFLSVPREGREFSPPEKVPPRNSRHFGAWWGRQDFARAAGLDGSTGVRLGPRIPPAHHPFRSPPSAAQVPGIPGPLPPAVASEACLVPAQPGERNVPLTGRSGRAGCFRAHDSGAFTGPQSRSGGGACRCGFSPTQPPRPQAWALSMPLRGA